MLRVGKSAKNNRVQDLVNIVRCDNVVPTRRTPNSIVRMSRTVDFDKSIISAISLTVYERSFRNRVVTVLT